MRSTTELECFRDNHADLNAVNHGCETPLFSALVWGWIDIDILDRRRDNGGVVFAGEKDDN